MTKTTELIKKVRTTCPYCGVGCGIIASVNQNNQVTIQGDQDHPANYGRLCSKGVALAETLSLDDRLLTPEINGQQVTWDTALETVAAQIKKSLDDHGSGSIAMYISGQLLTEDYYVANKFMKGFIGTANIDTNSRLCMSSAVAGYKRAFGEDVVPCDYHDLEQTDLLVIAGSNTAWCHPVFYQRIIKAREDNPALKIVVIDPRNTPTCDIADLHLPLKPGTDVILFNGLLNYLSREDALDWDFLEHHTEGFAAAIKIAKTSAPSIPYVADKCGLSDSEVANFFSLYSRTEKTISLFSQGINQSSQGTDKVNAIINCHLATGRIGKPGMGPFSITGQPNAMGGREVGGLANQLAAHMDIENPEHATRVKRFWRSGNMVDKPGYKAVDMFQAIDRGEIKILWIMATNPVDSLPDADKIKSTLKKCNTVIVSDCIKHTDTTELANILLPALTWGEKDGMVTNSERCISRQRKFLSQPGEARADWWIISEVAKRLGFEKEFNYKNPVDIFCEHALLSGFENNGQRIFDISGLKNLDDTTYETLTPVYWPLPNSKGRLHRVFSDGKFSNPDQKARLIAVDYVPPVFTPDEAYPFILNTGRVRDHWHTLTRTGKSTCLSQHTSQPIVEIHPRDAARFQLLDNSLVKITSNWGNIISRVYISDKQQPGSLFIPIHWNDQYASNAKINTLVNPVTDPVSGQPGSKYTPVNIIPLAMSWEGFYLTRIKAESPPCDYWVRIKGDNYWQYEIAGKDMYIDWHSWATKLMKNEDSECDWMEYSDASIGRYRAAKIRDGKLEGCLFIAQNQSQLPDRKWLQSLFKDTSLEKIECACLLTGKTTTQSYDTGQIVCSCFSVGRKTIQKTILEKNLVDVESIGKCLQAGTNCGSCIPELRQLLANRTVSSDAA